MSTIAVTELIVDTYESAESCSVEVELSVYRLVQSINEVWLNIELPSFCCTKVEHEVNSELRGEGVLTVTLCYAITVLQAESVAPAHTSECIYLKSTWLTRITTKPVAQVNSCHTIQVEALNSTCCHFKRFVTKHCLSLNNSTYSGCEPTSYANASRGVEILKNLVVLGRCLNATIDTNVPIVKIFALFNSLSCHGLC